MPRRVSLTDKGVAALKARADRYLLPDPELRGHYVRVMPSGFKSFIVVARDPLGKQTWTTIGRADVLTVDDARVKARRTITDIRSGRGRGEQETFKAVADQYLKRHVAAKGIRTEAEISRCLTKYIFPHWAARGFAGLRRSDVAALLDVIEDKHGPRQADVCLTIIRAIANWFATRNDGYQSPITRGMRRSSNTRRARILDDAELFAIWKAADGTFGDIIKIALLTAQRTGKIVSMRWPDVTMDGEWTIPAEHREKGTAGTLSLPKLAQEIIANRPRLASNGYIFAGRAAGHFNGASPCKRALGRQVAGNAELDPARP
jgi:integrase